MSNDELNEMIDWCRKKIRQEKSKPYRLSATQLDGYITAMKVVMSYLHSLKEKNDE